jgi:DnaJ-class molecular chaperone
MLFPFETLGQAHKAAQADVDRIKRERPGSGWLDMATAYLNIMGADICPSCKGSGLVLLHDSRDWTPHNVECSICLGTGSASAKAGSES